MDQNIFKKYSETYGTRFTNKQKAAFRKALIEDFKEIGYSHTIIAGKKNLSRAVNLQFGNMKHAKTVIAVPYDTPQHIFWWKSEYYPLDGLTSANKNLIPQFAPIVLLYVILLGLIYGSEGRLNAQGANFMFLLVSFLMVVLFYLMLHGVANRKNYVRNSAGIAAAYEIAKGLSKDEQRTTVFLFIDRNKARHLGAHIAAEDFLKQTRNPNVILFNCFALGSQLQLGYTPQTKKLALELSKLCGEEKLKTVALDDAMRSSSAAEHFVKAIVIAAGEADEKGRLLVKNTATAKDRLIDVANIDRVIQMVSSYLKK